LQASEDSEVYQRLEKNHNIWESGI
jgi:hypothetical protein